MIGRDSTGWSGHIFRRISTFSAFQTCGRGHAHDRRRSQTSRRQDRHHLRAAQLGLGNDPPSARAHDRAGWRPVRPGRALDRVPPDLLPSRSRAVSAVPSALPGDARGGARSRPPQVLRRPRRTRRHGQVRCLPRAAAQGRMGGLCKGAFRRAAGRARLPVALHPPCRHIQSPADLSRRNRRHLQMEGLPDRGPCSLQNDDPANP